MSNTANEIEIFEGKVLRLNNALSRDLESADPECIARTVRMLEAYAKSKKLTLYGPPVVRSQERTEGRATRVTGTFIAQVREAPNRVDPPYRFDPLIRVENCIMARFRGEERMLPIAAGKIQVHAFERGIDLKPGSYTVVTAKEGPRIVADVFMEAVG